MTTETAKSLSNSTVESTRLAQSVRDTTYNSVTSKNGSSSSYPRVSSVTSSLLQVLVSWIMKRQGENTSLGRSWVSSTKKCISAVAKYPLSISACIGGVEMGG